MIADCEVSDDPLFDENVPTVFDPFETMKFCQLEGRCDLYQSITVFASSFVVYCANFTVPVPLDSDML